MSWCWKADEKADGVDSLSFNEPQQANCYDRRMKASWTIWRFMGTEKRISEKRKNPKEISIFKSTDEVLQEYQWLEFLKMIEHKAVSFIPSVLSHR